MTKDRLDALIDALNEAGAITAVAHVNYGGDEGYWSMDSTELEPYREELEELINQLVENVPSNGEIYTTGYIRYEPIGCMLYLDATESDHENLNIERVTVLPSQKLSLEFLNCITQTIGSTPEIIYEGNEDAGQDNFESFYPPLKDGRYSLSDILALRERLMQLVEQNSGDTDDVERVRVIKEIDRPLILEIHEIATKEIYESIYLNEYEYENE